MTDMASASGGLTVILVHGAFADASGWAWQKLPSWTVVGTGDKAAGADVVRSMASRAGAQISEVDASHVPMMSQPDVVTEVILKAAQTVG